MVGLFPKLSLLFLLTLLGQTLLATPMWGEKLNYNTGDGPIIKDVTISDNFFLFEDEDFDGFSDKTDHDLDGDGIHNIVDLDPVNPNIKGIDIDQDGIFANVDIDFTLHIQKNEKAHAAQIQNEIFNQYGITLVIAAKTELREIKIIQELLQRDIVTRFNHLDVIVIDERNKNNSNYRGLYEKSWKQLTLYKTQLKEIEEFEMTLTHEFFHVIAQEDKAFYREFINAVGWQNNFYQHNGDKSHTRFQVARNSFHTGINKQLLNSNNFPSLYSASSPEEMFAEVGAATLLQDKSKHYLFLTRFSQYKEFKSSLAHQLMSDYLH